MSKNLVRLIQDLGNDGTFGPVVTSRLLTGFSATNATIASTDTILQAFNKAQGQIDTLGGSLTGYLQLTGGNMSGDILFTGGFGIDTTSTVGTDSLNIGVTNADVINIGTGTNPKIINVGSQSTLLDQINLYGAIFRQEVTNLSVSDKLVTYNVGGAAASGYGAGFEIEENAVITGYFKSSATRDGWDFKAPAISGVATLYLGGLTGNHTYTLFDSDDTFVGKATTDTFTNKTFDTAATGNVLMINGTTVSDTIGSGKVVLQTSPTLTTPALGVATATTINKVTITAPASSATLTISNTKVFSVSNTITLAGVDSTTITFQGTDTYVGRNTTDALTNKSGNISMWTNDSGYLTSVALSALTDVTISSIADAQLIIYSTGDSLWHNRTISGDITINNTGVSAIGNSKVTNTMLAGSIAATKLVGTDIVTVGTITSGTWQGNSISTTYTDAKIKGSAGVTNGILYQSGTADTATTNSALTYDGTTLMLGGASASTDAISISKGAATRLSFVMQNTTSTANTSIFVQNNRGSFASYGGFIYGGQTDGGSTIFGLARAERLFLIADGASNAGLAIGTLSNTAITFGTNGTSVMTLSATGVLTLSAAVTHVITSGNLSSSSASGFQMLNGGSAQFIQASGLYLSATYGVTPTAGTIICNTASDGTTIMQTRVNGNTRHIFSTASSGGHAQILTGNSLDLRLGSTSAAMFIDSTGRVSIATSTASTKAAYLHITAGATTNVSTGSAYAMGITGSANDTVTVASEIKNTNTGISSGAIHYLTSDTAVGFIGAFSSGHTAVPNVQNKIAVMALSASDGLVLGTRGTDSVFIVTNDTVRSVTNSSGYTYFGANTSATAIVQLGGNFTASSWLTVGIQLATDASTYTNSSTAASGTAATAVAISHAAPTFAASNSNVTITDASTMYISGAPTAGTNVTITRGWALYVAAGNTVHGGKTYLGATGVTPTAYLHIAAGTSSANTGPIKLTSGTNLATPEAGVIEYDGTSFYITPSATRLTIATLTGTETFTNKRINARTDTVASSATPTINTDTTDYFSVTALAVAITSMTTNLSGTPTTGQTLWISITDNGTARAITWGASFESSGNTALPTTTVISTRLDVAFIWNEATSKWRCIGVS